MTTTEHHYDYLIEIIGSIRKVTGLGHRPMLSELPEAIKQLLDERWRSMDTAPKDCRVLLWHQDVYTVPHIGWFNHASTHQMKLVHSQELPKRPEPKVWKKTGYVVAWLFSLGFFAALAFVVFQ